MSVFHWARQFVKGVAKGLADEVDEGLERVKRVADSILPDDVVGEHRILVLGLPQSGRSSLISKITSTVALTRIHPSSSSDPVPGFTSESCRFKNVRLHLLDLAADNKTQSLLRHFADASSSCAVIYVVDSCATDCELQDSAAELRRIRASHPRLQQLPLLIYCTKQDLAASRSVAEICNALAVPELFCSFPVASPAAFPAASSFGSWYIQGCSAASGAGIDEGLRWLYEKHFIVERKKKLGPLAYF